MNKIEINLLQGYTHRDQRVAELLRKISEVHMSLTDDQLTKLENEIRIERLSDPNRWE